MSYREPLSLPTSGIPKIIFQTWKSHTEIPANFRYWSQTWKTYNPDYEYILWDDANNRAFIADKFPWFLSTFDGYKRNINRADAARYFFLYYYGGIYADMDFECLQSFDSLLNTHSDASVILGRMDGAITHSIPNALMISKPRDPLWIHVFKQLLNNKGNATVETATGPVMLYDAIQSYNNKPLRTLVRKTIFLSPVKSVKPTSYDAVLSKIGSDMEPYTDTKLTLLPPTLFYPISWTIHADKRIEALGNNDYDALTHKSRSLYPTAFAVTYWTHGW